MTMTFKPDLDSIKVNRPAKYLGQRSFSSKVTVPRHRQTHAWDQLLYL